MSKKIFTDKYYTHLDGKKKYKYYEERVRNPIWVQKHGFYPFIHFKINMNKYTKDNHGKKYVKGKNRDIYYSAHIDRFIYQYYGNRLNDNYNDYAKQKGINKAVTAYRNCFKGKCNIDFAKEVFEFIVESNSAFVFVADFSNFFDKLDHKYLKEKIKIVNKEESLNVADYTIYKNLTRYSYVEASDIEVEKGEKRSDMRRLAKYFDTEELQRFKTNNLMRNPNNYGIPQGSSISSVYANVYMIDFDKEINDYVTSKKGMYRRYCDDIIIVIPMTHWEKDNNIYLDIINNIISIKNKIPNLILNEEKTEQFYYNHGSLEKISGESRFINYLGFTFDGISINIREKSLFKYYCRAYGKIKRIKEVSSDEKAYNAGKKAVYKLYTHLGVSKNQKKYGNFLTYAYKAHKVFDESEYLESEVRNQVKRHWIKIENRLKTTSMNSETQPSEKSKTLR